MLSMISRQLLQRSMAGFNGIEVPTGKLWENDSKHLPEEPAYTQKSGPAKAPAHAAGQLFHGRKRPISADLKPISASNSCIASNRRGLKSTR
jgi:hypothetical protein